MVCEESRVNERVMAESERRESPSHYTTTMTPYTDIMARTFPPLALGHYSPLYRVPYTPPIIVFEYDHIVRGFSNQLHEITSSKWVVV